VRYTSTSSSSAVPDTASTPGIRPIIPIASSGIAARSPNRSLPGATVSRSVPSRSGATPRKGGGLVVTARLPRARDA